MVLLPVVCIAVWSTEQFRLQCMLECLQWRQWRDRRRQHVPDFCSGDGEGTIADGLVQRPWNMQRRWRCRLQTPKSYPAAVVQPLLAVWVWHLLPDFSAVSSECPFKQGLQLAVVTTCTHLVFPLLNWLTGVHWLMCCFHWVCLSHCCVILVIHSVHVLLC